MSIWQKEKVYYVDTVAGMLALTGVKDGTRVDTARYSTSHTVGDGSGGEYVYHATGRSGITADAGFFHSGAGADDYWAAVKVDSILQCGAIPNDDTKTTENLAAVQAMQANRKAIRFPSVTKSGLANTTYYFANPITVQSGESWHGDGWRNTQLKWTADTPAGECIVLRGTNSFTGLYLSGPVSQKTVATVDPATDRLTVTSHGFSNGDKVRVWSASTLASGLSLEQDYYAIVVDTNTLQVETSPGGGAIDITSTGTGTHYIAVVNWDGVFSENPGDGRCRFYDCNFSGWGTGVKIDGGIIMDFYGCYLTSNYVAGLRTIPSQAGNAIHWWGGEVVSNRVGFQIESSALGFSVSGSTIEANTLSGFKVTGGGAKRGISLRDNYFEANGKAHIWIDSTATLTGATVINGNQFSGAVTAADIYIEAGYYATVGPNYHGNTGVTHVHLTATTARDNTIVESYSDVAAALSVIDSGNRTRYQHGNHVRDNTNLDTTPNVSFTRSIRITNSSATNITTFDGGYKGQVLLCIFSDGNTTIVDGTIITISGGNITPSAGDTIELLYDGTNWIQTQ